MWVSGEYHLEKRCSLLQGHDGLHECREEKKTSFNDEVQEIVYRWKVDESYICPGCNNRRPRGEGLCFMCDPPDYGDDEEE